MPDISEKQQSPDDKLFFGGEKESNDIQDIHHVHQIDVSLAIDVNAEGLNNAKGIIDKALNESSANPGALGSPEFAEAVKLVSANQCAWFEYRSKIKSMKPSGVPMANIDNMTAQSATGDRQDSTSAELIGLVMGSGELFYDSQADKAFVSVDIKDVAHTLAIGNKSFVDWLSYAYYMATKRGDLPGKSASESAIKQACFALAGIAKHEGKDERVYLRVADHNGGHYIFIGNDNWQVIEVLPSGWRVIDNSPVKFWMPGTMQSLPIPKKGGDLSQLWKYLNIPEQERSLVLAWTLESFRNDTPKPILALIGTSGCAKSSTQDKLRQLGDNNSGNLKSAPKTVEDIFVSAGCNRYVSYENLSRLSQAMQDAFCTVATGGSYSGRKLFTNAEESTIDVKRPVIINSIPSVLTAQDATDRAITIDCPSIDFREQSEIDDEWDKAKSDIFGGLLDLFVKTLAQLPKVKLVKPPRMADFTRLGEAMAQVLGNPPGTFDTLYKANRAEVASRSLESSPAAVAIRELVEKHSGLSLEVFNGTMKSLLETLESYKQKSLGWPATPRGLGDVLRRQKPAFNLLGIHIEISKPKNDGVHVTIEKKKSEHGERCEHGLDQKPPKEKITPLNSAAFKTESF